VIATTPVAPPRTPARAPAAAVAPTPARTPARTSAPTPAAAAAPAPETAPKAVPGAVELDKIPSNVQTVGASAFDGTKASDLLQSLDRALPGVSLSSQTGNDFQLDLNYRGFHGLTGYRYAARARRLPKRGAHQRGLWRRRQLGFHPAECHQPANAGSQQSSLRPERDGWRARVRDEEWILLSRR
jgi:hypothetical protein